MADEKPKSGLGSLLGGLAKPPSDPVEPVEGDSDAGGSPAETAAADAAISAIETGDRRAFRQAMRAMFDAFRAQDEAL